MASNVITLDVGGTVYKTLIETLTRYPDSKLGEMFKTQHGNSGSQLDPSNKDEHGRFFIDRDGPMFRYVLNFLRNSSLNLPEDFKELVLLRREAEFYQIKPLIEAVDKAAAKAVDKAAAKAVDKVAAEAVPKVAAEAVHKVATEAVDKINPKTSSSYKEWAKQAVFSLVTISWDLFGRQMVIDKIKKEVTKYLQGK